jgi:hypothetical protein
VTFTRIFKRKESLFCDAVIDVDVDDDEVLQEFPRGRQEQGQRDIEGIAWYYGEERWR